MLLLVLMLLLPRLIRRRSQANRGDSWHAVKRLWGLVWPLVCHGHVEMLQSSNGARFVLVYVHQVCHTVHHVGNLQRAHIAPYIPMFHQFGCLQSKTCASLRAVTCNHDICHRQTRSLLDQELQWKMPASLGLRQSPSMACRSRHCSSELQCDYTSKAGVEGPKDAAAEPDGMQNTPLLQNHAQDWR